MLRFTGIIACFLLFSAMLYAQQPNAAGSSLVFEANRNQWPQQVEFMTDIRGGRVFLEKNCFTFVLHSEADLEKAHEDSHTRGADMRQAIIRSHAFRVYFSDSGSTASGTDLQPAYRNYFIGNDSSKWTPAVPLFNSVMYPQIHPGISLRAYGNGSNLEYDYIVAPGADASAIREIYEGVDAVSIGKDGAVLIRTSVGDFIQQKPIAWQIINGIRKNVPVAFRLDAHSSKDRSAVVFDFPSGYNTAYELIIDPLLIASTYSGSVATVYGHCATYDLQGNIFTGGLAFAQGYPVTTGAFQTVFGGNTDIAISKFSPNGSALLFATYIGGNGADYPYSLVVNAADELFIYGASYSLNYPVTANAYDPTCNNAPNSFKTDIIVTHLNATGTSLVGSTYMGGPQDDGYNNVYTNYGDHYRGEIILDAAGDVYVASFSQSATFPVSPAAYDNTLDGLQDGVVFKMNGALTTLQWGTFLGGSADDGAFGLVLDASANVYVAGATNSNNFPVTAGALHTSYQGGIHDGFITQLSANGATVIASTYFGTAARDAVFLTDLDMAGNIFVFGQSEGAMPVTANVYSNPNSPQFISRLDPALTTIQVSTVFGSGSMTGLLVPTAFLVDECNHIYASGWSTDVSGFPVSANAIQTTTDNQDFYLMVMEEDAASLMYATYFGGTGSDHADGGTSRFDPTGVVYEAICTASANIATTSSAYSPTHQTPNNDLAVLKLDFQAQGVIADAAAGNGSFCTGAPVTFTNNSFYAVDFFWDFGDATPIDTNFQPTHIYTTAGSYTVTLIAMDSSSCGIADTFFLPITILPLPVLDLGSDTVFCGAVNLLLDATSANCTYTWSTGALTPTLLVTDTATYWVEIDNGSCRVADTISVSSVSPPDLGNDTTICAGESVVLDAGNPDAQFVWSTGQFIQAITASAQGIYWVDMTQGGCVFRDSMALTVINVPFPALGPDSAICPGSVITLNVSDPAPSYQWSDGSTGMSMAVSTPGTYSVTATIGACVVSDAVNISYVAYLDLGDDALLCGRPDGLVLDAGNAGSQYTWSTGASSQQITVTEPGTYWVSIANAFNCPLSDTINVDGDAAGGLMYLPNCFTPNSDGRNEYFCPESSELTSISMQIFDRWGVLVYQTNTIGDCWDGRYHGSVVPQDVYVVRLRYTTNCTGTHEYMRVEHVTVLR